MATSYVQTSILAVTVILWLGCNKPKAIYPQRKNLTETVYASGKIIPGNEFRLASMSSGTIIKKLVKDGDAVRKGQLIYIVSNEAAKDRYAAVLKSFQASTINLSEQSPLLNDLKLAVKNAQLQCSNDSSVYYRYKNLWAQDIGTKSNLDNVRTRYEISLNQKKIAEEKYNATISDLEVSRSNARSQLSAAGKDLKEYFIRSDRDGVIYQTFKEAGESVLINETVALIGEHSNPVVRMAVDQQDINKIRKGQEVLLQTDITGNKVYQAEVSYVYPVMNEQDQTFRVDAVFTGETPSLFIHGSVEANIVVRQKENTLVLPRSVLAGGDSVWVNEKGKTRKMPIQTGISTLEYIEVMGGLDEKTPVLLINETNK